MKEEILKILPSVRKPSRYLGGERNAVKKDLTKVNLKVALGYPDAYEIGMSHVGLSILYHLLNDRPDIACERVYAPWTDMEAQLRDRKLPLTSLESGLPLRDFDILGISLPHELTYTNILTLLDLAGIPFFARDRDESYPLLLGGGTFNPEPVADFFDAIVIGDGEEAILEICEAVKEWKNNTPPPPLTVRGGGRERVLRELAHIPGLYIPSFFDVTYKEDGTIAQIKPLLEGYTGVQKRTVSDLDPASCPDRPIVPHAKTIHDRIAVEVQRGCVRGCRFCQAGYVYRPERQRSPDTVKRIVKNQLAATGHNEVSLLSLSIGDYGCLDPLVKDLMDELGPRRVGLSLPATRVEQLSPAIMEEIRRVRKTGFTVAPEAATDRMRKAINKGNSEENLLATVHTVFSHGWELMKFYFMIGLPTETDEDVVAIARLAGKAIEIGLRERRRAEINLGVSPFVPKPFTPYQWVGQIALSECHRRLDLLRSHLKTRRLHLKPHRPEVSYLEGIFSRGDRRLSSLIIAAWKKGCRFDEWDEGIRFDLWKEAWTELGIDPAFYVLRERGRDEVLPWDHLFTEMKKEWLWKEYEASLAGAFTEDCSTGKCTQCGVCDFKEVRNRAYEGPGGILSSSCGTPRASELSRTPPGPFVYHCTFSKTGPAVFLSHLEFVDAIRRAVSRAGLPIRFSQGFHPLPKISFGPAMAVGKEVTGQTFSMELEKTIDPETIRQGLNEEVPEGILIQSVISEGDLRSSALHQRLQPLSPPP